ncbi:abscisic aldehyde oxidase 3 [Tanacetum coccineum]|uniref:Abscisic aldehyde oxidase 3 n=1 Tax=Tanacetum coccineum TaxID=301880 RepID=A0ABQ4ZXL1_9ASTR
MHLDILVNVGMSTDISPIMPWNMIGSLKKYDLGAFSFDLKDAVENSVVRASCGVMDQMASACGEANKLLAMVCSITTTTYRTYILRSEMIGLRAREKLKAPHVLAWMLTEAKVHIQAFLPLLLTKAIEPPHYISSCVSLFPNFASITEVLIKLKLS